MQAKILFSLKIKFQGILLCALNQSMFGQNWKIRRTNYFFEYSQIEKSIKGNDQLSFQFSKALLRFFSNSVGQKSYFSEKSKKYCSIVEAICTLKIFLKLQHSKYFKIWESTTFFHNLQKHLLKKWINKFRTYILLLPGTWKL